MKKIEAFIRHEAFEPIRTELLEKGIPSMSILEAKGSGRQKGIVETYRGSTVTVNESSSSWSGGFSSSSGFSPGCESGSTAVAPVISA